MFYGWIAAPIPEATKAIDVAAAFMAAHSQIKIPKGRDSMSAVARRIEPYMKVRQGAADVRKVVAVARTADDTSKYLIGISVKPVLSISAL
jgi:hypothetical protein